MPEFDFEKSLSCNIAGEAIFEAARKSDKVWGLTHDLGFILAKLQELYPEQCVDQAESEQSAVKLAAKLAREGNKPFIFGKIPYLTTRAFEQIRNRICYQNLPVTIVGLGEGLIPTGGSVHNCIEDIGLMRSLINMSVVSVSDPRMINSFIQESLDFGSPLYIRQVDSNASRYIYDDDRTDYPIGKGLVVREGKDVTIITNGSFVCSALDAAEVVAEHDIDVRIIDMYSIRPLDKELVLEAINEAHSIIIVEDHLKRGGLSSAIAELIIDKETYPKHIIRMGIPDVIPDVIPDIFRGCDSEEMLREKCSFGSKAILRKIREFAWPLGSEGWTHHEKHPDKHPEKHPDKHHEKH